MSRYSTEKILWENIKVGHRCRIQGLGGGMKEDRGMGEVPRADDDGRVLDHYHSSDSIH